MRDELLYYYERELGFIRRMASDFARRYPEVAGRLLIEETKCDDPHVERLIESFAMLSARIRMRLDDDFSEVTDALLSVLYPHYISPVPSMSIVQLEMDPDAGGGPEGFKVERHSVLYSKPVKGLRCRFRTAYPVTLWPIEVESVGIVTTTELGARIPGRARSALRIRLRALAGTSFSEFSLDRLRFFLDAPSGVVHQLYELFLRDPQGIAVQRGPATPVEVLGPDHVQPAGFGKDEGLLVYPDESFLGYRLLQEYFAFSEKFQFVDLVGLDQLSLNLEGDHLDVSVLLSESVGELDLRVEPQHLKLGCTPAVNLFEHNADPIRLTHTAVEYPVMPDARTAEGYEVYSLRSVTSTEIGSSAVKHYLPIYTLRHGADTGGAAAFWYGSRRPSIRRDDTGTDFFISLVDDQFDPLAPPTEVLNIETLCTNRDLPSRLPFGDPQGDFHLEDRPGISKVTCLRNPTPPLRPPAGHGSRWRIISHLALNHLSLTDSEDTGVDMIRRGTERRALEAFQEILKLYDFADSPVTRQRISGLVGMGLRKIIRPIGRGELSGFARGVEVELQFDADQYTGTGVFLFASVLEAFLALYASVNSFTQTVARIRQREGIVKRWPPRAGEIQLL
jgi:type VI secretion system protein ImpG